MIFFHISKELELPCDVFPNNPMYACGYNGAEYLFFSPYYSFDFNLKKEQKMEKKYLTAKEVATYLNMAISTLAAFRSENKGPSYTKIGRLVRYRQEDVDKWLEESQDNAQNSLDNHDNLPNLSDIKRCKNNMKG